MGERVIVGVDGSLTSHAAMRWALGHARRGDEICFLHAAVPSPTVVAVGLIDERIQSGRDLVDRELARARNLRPPEGVRLTCDCVAGDPKAILCNYPGDLIVVGSGDHGSLARRLLGSVAEHLTRHSAIPVVIVPLGSLRSGQR